MAIIKPFGDDSSSVGIGGLTVENGLDRVVLYGSLEITRDRAGLGLARELAELLNAAVAALSADPSLPDHVVAEPADRTIVRNPFLRPSS
jgi:hypothetical protein